MDQAIDHRRRNGVVAEDLTPTADGEVAGDQPGPLFTADSDQLQEQNRRISSEGQIPKLNNDQQPVPA